MADVDARAAGRRLALRLALLLFAPLPACRREASAPAPPAGSFVARGAESGVAFVHEHGGTDRKHFPEIMVGGVSLFDFDGDGDLDLHCSQAAALPGRAAGPPLTDRLFRNDGGFRFADVTDAAGVAERGYTMSSACADVDGDGDLDLYCCNFGRNTLYANLGDGRFEDVTESSGLGSASWSSCAAFADLDRDGDLDAYVANYVVYDLATAKPCGGAVGSRDHDYCNPDVFPGARDDVLRNDGGRDGAIRFVDVTREAGAARSTGKALAVVPTDVDGDGDVDLFVANDRTPNFLWRNDSPPGGPIRLVETGFESGVAQDGAGKSESCMGSDAVDVDHDGDFELFAANMAMETNTLWVNQGGGLFEDRTDVAGLARDSWLWVGFGAKFLDQDLDGERDLVVLNGHVLVAAERDDPQQSFAQRAQLYRGSAGGRFRLAGASAGPYFDEKHVGRGLAAGDLDGDGDVDLVAAHWLERPELLENTAIAPGRAARWIGIDLRGKDRNTRAIGARVECRAGALYQVDEVRGAASYAAWNDTRLVFGLASHEGRVDLRIRWPDGTWQDVRGAEPGRYHRIAQP